MLNRLYLAPIKGITDKVFRKVFSDCFSGIDIAVAPFITISEADKKIRALSTEANNKIKTIPQMLTKKAEHFLAISRKFAEYDIDKLNWNLGCPFKKVIDRGEGSALLMAPDAIKKFLDKIFNEKTADISIKMRLGMKSPDEILPIIETLNNYPVTEVIIHARTADQMYDGDVKISSFINILGLIKHKVVYNGDITHYKDIAAISELTGDIHCWMIGRGLLSNPFLAEEIHAGKTINADEKIQRIKKFIDLLFNEYQSELMSHAHVLDKMRGIWSYLSQSFDDSKKVEKKIRKALNLKHYSDEIERLFNNNPKIINIESSLMKNKVLQHNAIRFTGPQ
jgi:tRNA-dihydrouridine synthase